jgi:putative acetyltransferase
MKKLITDSPEFDIRYTRVTDTPYLKNWIDRNEIMKWFPFDREETQDIEHYIRNWIGFSRFKASLTATIGHHPCGMATLYLLPYKKVAHSAIFQLVVDPDYQRQGIGFSLLKNLKHLAKNFFKLTSLHIEVMEGNPGLALLIKSGFFEVSRQEGYYKRDGKYLAKIVMEIEL